MAFSCQLEATVTNHWKRQLPPTEGAVTCNSWNWHMAVTIPIEQIYFTDYE